MGGVACTGVRTPIFGIAAVALLLSNDVYNHAFPCRVNVPDETGKMSQSDKRGATLPKVVATSVAKLTDEFPEGRLTAENIYATEIVTEA